MDMTYVRPGPAIHPSAAPAGNALDLPKIGRYAWLSGPEGERITAAIIEAYQTASIAEISKATGWGCHAIRALLLRNSVTLRPTGRRAGRAKPPKTALTPRHKQVAERLVRGASTAAIAAALRVSARTVDDHLYDMRRRLRCPYHCTTAVLVHQLLLHRHVDPPERTGPAPDFADTERRLIRAVATHSSRQDIARAAGVDHRSVDELVNALLDSTGSASPATLVAFGHRWGLFEDPACVTEHPVHANAEVAR
jgi:DNA-binding CsgD family transcriptional regulator